MPTVFALAAHPDDVEFVMAGTLFLLKERGFDVHYMNIANGSLGTEELTRDEIVRIRTAEARDAATFLGATFHDPLVDDLSIFYDKNLLAKVASVMRQVGPDILLLQSLSDYMEDHQNAARLGVAAAFSRGMKNFAVDPPCPITRNDVAVYHAQPHGNRDPMRKQVHAEQYVDIESVLSKKREMLAKHVSQKAWLDASQGMDSYLVSMENAAEEVGRLSGRFRFAEGWRRHYHVGLSGTEIDPLRDVLADISLASPPEK